MMTNASTGVAIVAMQLPQTDRRALSQAWYSALHIADDGAPPFAANGRRASTAVRQSRSNTPHVAESAGHVRPHAALAPKRPQAPQGARDGAERRTPKTELARRIERAVVRRRALIATQPSSIALKAAGGRVALLVRSTGDSTRIVALCAPVLRERVERALAQARFALAARGTRIEVAS